MATPDHSRMASPALATALAYERISILIYVSAFDSCSRIHLTRLVAFKLGIRCCYGMVAWNMPLCLRST
eukprot:5779900-Pleurochrysis_carterae.AAC.1